MVALKYAVMLSGVDEVIMMKSDVLSGFDTIRAGVAYQHEGETIEHVPYDLCRSDIEPIWKEFPGWQEDITGARQLSDLPQTFLNYLQWVEETLEIPVSVISVGPDREQTIKR
jgi:adenylosuccinate synthase